MKLPMYNQEENAIDKAWNSQAGRSIRGKMSHLNTDIHTRNLCKLLERIEEGDTIIFSLDELVSSVRLNQGLAAVY